jgi:acyl-CoA reductase-like NAD-dependent aldehyde dehydrogenase
MDSRLPDVLRPARLWIEDTWKDGAGPERRPLVNPATEALLTEASEAAPSDVAAAVDAASRCLAQAWGPTPSAGKAKVLWKIADLLEERRDEIAAVETLNQGKPIRDAVRIDVPLAAAAFRYFAGWATKLHGETLPVQGPFLAYTRREPVGVCGLIVPWNFPLLLASYKVASALAAGCTAVLKPAEDTPLTALLLAQLARDAGLPAGALNVVTGGPAVGSALVSHPGVNKVSFTGSTSVGREILRQAAATMTRTTLELGGKSPSIVFNDVDPEAAAKSAALGIFYNKGEVCTAASRLLVQEPIHDEVVDRLRDKAAAMTPGDPLDPATRMGPQASSRHRERILAAVAKGRAEGASLIAGGAATSVGGKGFYMEPTVFRDVRPEMSLAREEIFGPVLSVLSFEGEEEAVRLANDNPYGLAAAVWTRDIERGHRVAHAVRAGTVWINAVNLYDPAAPYGGVKASGFGRELGLKGLEEFTETKTVWVHVGSGTTS